MCLGKILFVEDNISICNVYAHVLTEAGYFLRYAIDGQGALKLFGAHSFDIIICDFYLPDIDGIQLINTIQQKDKNLYSILFTSSSLGETESLALTQGVDDFVLKPCSKDRLLLGIKKGIKIRQERITNKLIEKKIKELAELTQRGTREAHIAP